MPAYEYQCNACGNHFEQRQKMSDPAIETCPGCGGSVKRLISGGAAVISKSGSSAEAGCGSGAPCCGQGGCGNGDYCHQ
jgi:putative FmdB family regulatory protein